MTAQPDFRSLMVLDTRAATRLAHLGLLDRVVDTIGDHLRVSEALCRDLLVAEERGEFQRLRAPQISALAAVAAALRVAPDPILSEAIIQHAELRRLSDGKRSAAEALAATVRTGDLPVLGEPRLVLVSRLVLGKHAASPKDVASALHRDDFSNLVSSPWSRTTKAGRKVARGLHLSVQPLQGVASPNPYLAHRPSPTSTAKKAVEGPGVSDGSIGL